MERDRTLTTLLGAEIAAGAALLALVLALVLAALAALGPEPGRADINLTTNTPIPNVSRLWVDEITVQRGGGIVARYSISAFLASRSARLIRGISRACRDVRPPSRGRRLSWR